ncbi:MAG: alkaline phosphatase family protein [Pseudomonadota bacterium]
MTANGGTPTLMIGLDAGEISLVESWMADGSLPTLASLRNRGAYGPLASTAEWLVGSPWPTFYAGIPPEEHGLCHYLLWRADQMNMERVDPSWLPVEPFWHGLARSGRRAVVINVPVKYAPTAFDGIEIGGWAAHESLMPPAAHPPEVMNWLHESFPEPPPDHEENRLLEASEPDQIRDRCNHSTKLLLDMATQLMQRESWDLFLVCLSATHRAGHALWDASSLADAGPEDNAAMQNRLREVYVACDAAIGRLIEQAGPQVHTLVFSVHGMGVNTSRNEILPQMLDRVLSGDATTATPVRRLAESVRSLVPDDLRSRLKSKLPSALQDRLTRFWRTGGVDWSKTRAFVPFCDNEGYVRINLRGREAAGAVEPGEPYEQLCAEITEGLLSFTDDDTGERVVEQVGRSAELFDAGACHDRLPDLVIRWSPRPAAKHRQISSPRHGAIAWPNPGRVASCRAGNHWPTGFLFGAGGDIPAGSSIEKAHILDLAPTVHALLNLPVPTQMRGRPLF